MNLSSSVRRYADLEEVVDGLVSILVGEVYVGAGNLHDASDGRETVVDVDNSYRRVNGELLKRGSLFQ